MRLVLTLIVFWSAALRADPCTLLLAGPEDPTYFEMRRRILAEVPADTRVVRAGEGLWVQDWFPHLLEDAGGTVAVFPKSTAGTALDRRDVRQGLERHGTRVSPNLLPIVGGNFVRLGDVVVTVDSKLLLDDELAPFGLEPFVIAALPRETTEHADMMVADGGAGVAVVADSRDPARRQTLARVARQLRARGLSVTRVMNGGFDAGTAALSYANVLHLGDRVLVPAYAEYARALAEHWPCLVRRAAAADELFGALDDARLDAWAALVAEDDRRALATWRGLGFDARPVELNEIFEYAGSLHCLARAVTGPAQRLVPDAF